MERMKRMATNPFLRSLCIRVIRDSFVEAKRIRVPSN